MRRSQRWQSIVALCSLACSMLAVRPAAALSVATDAAALADAAQQRGMLERIRDAADPAWRPVLEALKDGALYRWHGRLLILNDNGEYQDLAGKPLLDAAGQPLAPEEGLEQVSLDDANTALLHRALDLIELSSPDPDTRKTISLELGNLKDASFRPPLERALAVERVPAVAAVMAEAVNKLRLADPDAAVRLQAVQWFDAQRSESVLGLLTALQAHEPDGRVRAAARAAAGRIETYLRWRSVIGYAFNGVSLASILLLMSLGLAITFGLMGIINMAHGEMLMLGSYTAYIVQETFAAHWPGYQDYYFLLALPLSLLFVGGFGFLLERGMLRFLYGRPLESLLVTWGISMILQQGARLTFGDQTSVNPPTWFRGGMEVMPGLILPYSRVFIIGLALLSLVVVYLLLNRSTAGLQIRAVMQNRGMASCVGISTRRVDARTFALGTALAGLAGCALALIGTVDPEVGQTYIVDSFMVVVLGGVGKLLGTVFASFCIGMGNKLLEPAIGGTAAAVYAKVLILVFVIVFLQRRPTGLFPAKGRISEFMSQ